MKNSTNEISAAGANTEELKFHVSFDPTKPGDPIKIDLPSGKSIVSDKKEVRKHFTRSIIKACKDNGMCRKASVLRLFMKDQEIPKQKQEIARRLFLDVPDPKRRKESDKAVTKMTKDLENRMNFEGVKDVVPRKRGGWTNEEDEKILAHAKEHGDTKWHVLAENMPGRVARQCCNRHKKLVTTAVEIKKGHWTNEEDAIIVNHVKQFGDNDWPALAGKLSQRNAHQCRNRHIRLLAKANESPIKRGGWTEEEDEKILGHGKDIGDQEWSSLAQLLPRRTSKQCQNRFKKLSTKQSAKVIKRGEWTEAEDEKILNHVKNVGAKDWRSLASQFPDRKGMQLRNRFKKLNHSGSEEKGMWKKGGWTEEEDRAILEHFKLVGDKDWGVLASKLPDRKANQCRRRHSKLSAIKIDKKVD